MKYKLPITLIILSLFASLAISAPKGMKRLSQLDQDDNGQVNFEEFSKNHLERFSDLDKNSDGIISQEEFLMPISNHFQRMDLNSDGAIEKAEAKKAMRGNKQKIKKKRKKRDKKRSFNKN